MNRKKHDVPLKVLRRERDKLNAWISELERKPRRLIDVANERLVERHRFKVLEVDGNPRTDKSWSQLERIFCKTKCSTCPHGDYWYRYTKSLKGKIRIELTGELVFDYEVLKALKKRLKKPVMAEFELEDRNA